MKFNVERTEVTFTHNGKVYTATVGGSGYYAGKFDAGRYRGQDLSGYHSIEAIKNQMAALDDEAEEKKVRRAAMKRAASDPTPATDTRGNDIMVRGIDGRSGDVLILEADGSKGKRSYRHGVLRRLTDEERAEQYRLISEAEEPEPEHATSYTAREIFKDVTLDAAYVPEAGMFRTQYDGQEFEAQGLQELRSLVESHVVRQEFPVAVTGGQVWSTPEDVHQADRLFKSKEAAGEWLVWKTRNEKARQALRDFNEKHAFDLSTIN